MHFLQKRDLEPDSSKVHTMTLALRGVNSIHFNELLRLVNIPHINTGVNELGGCRVYLGRARSTPNSSCLFQVGGNIATLRHSLLKVLHSASDTGISGAYE